MQLGSGKNIPFVECKWKFLESIRSLSSVNLNAMSGVYALYYRREKNIIY